jgi:hypothetical protein
MKKYLLTFSVIFIFIGLQYLFLPQMYVKSLEYGKYHVDALNLIRSCGGLYLAISVLLIIIHKNEDMQRKTVAACVIVMAGFLIGRCISMAIDGIPEEKYIVSAVFEAVLFIWGAWLLKKRK